MLKECNPTRRIVKATPYQPPSSVGRRAHVETYLNVRSAKHHCWLETSIENLEIGGVPSVSPKRVLHNNIHARLSAINDFFFYMSP